MSDRNADTESAVVTLDGISKWYGPVLGVSDISWQISGGVVGLLGPNGAGKSTLIKLIVGLHRPSRGSVSVFGEDPFFSAQARAQIGYCPEHEEFYNELTALEFVTTMAALAGVSGTPMQVKKRAAEALAEMGLTKAMNRRVGGFSKGMKQRTKLAQCLVHDPDLWILDEPLTGVDPVARVEIVNRLQKLGAAGKTIIVSSHVLREVESITQEILVVYRGQVLAEGNIYKIRSLIDAHPHRIRVDCDEPRKLGSALASADHVQSLTYDRSSVIVETVEPDTCYDRIVTLAIEGDVGVRAMTSTDNNLSAVFDYLDGSAAMSRHNTVGGFAASAALARLTWVRLLRGKALWATGVLALLALSLAGAKPDASVGERWELFVQAGLFPLLLISVALHLAAAVSEEVENKTSTYLWSRPIPRWTVATGKLMTVVPVLFLIYGGIAAAAFYIVGKGEPMGPMEILIRTVGSVGLLCLSGSIAAVTLGSLLPRQAAAAAVGYFATDSFLGALPFSIAKLSLTHHARTLAGLTDSNVILSLVVWVGIASIWGFVLVQRLTKSNLGAAK